MMMGMIAVSSRQHVTMPYELSPEPADDEDDEPADEPEPCSRARLPTITYTSLGCSSKAPPALPPAGRMPAGVTAQAEEPGTPTGSQARGSHDPPPRPRVPRGSGRPAQERSGSGSRARTRSQAGQVDEKPIPGTAGQEPIHMAVLVGQDHLMSKIICLLGTHPDPWRKRGHWGWCGQSCPCCRAHNPMDWPTGCDMCVQMWYLTCISKQWRDRTRELPMLPESKRRRKD